jgi:hypothetical protein
MYRIDDALKEFLESGVAVIVGTGDAAGRPHVTFAWGPRVHESRTRMDVFLEAARSDRPLANLRANDRIAMTVAHPVIYRSVQLKGRFYESAPLDEADQAWVTRHRDDFLVTTSLIGDPPAAIQAMWLDEVIRITFDTEAAFDQTPGPKAGRAL